MSLLRPRTAQAVQTPAEQRATYAVPSFLSADSGTYANVDMSSLGTSLQSVAVRTTADLICSLASELPVHVYTGEGAGRRQIRTPGNIEDPDGSGHGVEDWMYRLLMSWLMRGNAYGDEIEHDRRARPTRILWHYPDDVSGTQNADGSVTWRINGREVKRPDMFVHKPVNPMPGRVLGLSPIDLHATQIGVSLSAGRFGRQWFTDGAHPSALLTNDNDLTQVQADTAKARWMAAMHGSREPAVLGNGWDYKAVQLTPEQSQFLKTQDLSEAQCARMFGPGFAEVLGYDSGGSMTYANVVERRSDVLVLSMNKWLRRVERVLGGLVAPSQYVRLDRDALLESTTIRRYQAHALALSQQWKTVNEVREDEDMAPVSWGNEPVASPSTDVSVPGPGEG